MVPAARAVGETRRAASPDACPSRRAVGHAACRPSRCPARPQLLHIMVRESVAQVPSHRQGDHLRREPNPAKPDLGADTREGRRRINPACPLVMIADATVPPHPPHPHAPPTSPPVNRLRPGSAGGVPSCGGPRPDASTASATSRCITPMAYINRWCTGTSAGYA
jgi:hypothetical protein